MSDNKEQIFIKTICDFLFLDQYEDTASFLRFEQCFQPLFNNINISFESIFKDICGEKKKYITYKRFAKSYLNYKNGINISKDTKTFFDLLLTSIIKFDKEYVGEVKKNIYIYSTIKTSSKRNTITKVQVLSDKNNQIRGINIEYDGVSKNKMHPKNIELDLDIILEMNLNCMEEKSTIIQNKARFGAINKSNYIDAITHIFGTLNPETGFISFIGFKCISGKTVYAGLPKGKGFLFGKFGYKFHDLKLQMTENGITRMEPGFNLSIRKNIYLNKIPENLFNINLNDENVIKDEEYFDKLKDINEIDKLLTTSIISDDHIFKEKPKDLFCGNDYKEVVDQAPRKWILKIIQHAKKKDEKKNMTLDDALNNYNQECEKTKDKMEKLRYIEDQQAYNSNKENKDLEKAKDEWTGLILHKKKAYKNSKKNNNNQSMVLIRNKLKLSMINPNKNKNASIIMFSRNNYDQLRNKLGMMINDEIFENNSDEKYVERKSNDNISFESKNFNNKNTIIKMKNLKGETVVLDDENKEKMKNAKEKWVNFRKGLEKVNGVYLLQTIGSVIKAKNVLQKKINIPLEEKIKLFDLLGKNKRLFKFLSQKQIGLDKIEEEDDDEEDEDEKNIMLIPDKHPEKNMSLEDLQKIIDNLKELLKKTDIKEEDRKKLEKLLNLYIQQKNILIENQSNNVKDELISKMGINIAKYIQKEKEKRAKAKEEEQKKLEEEMRKRKEEEELKRKKRENNKYKSFIALKKPDRIFHKQKMPGPIEEWTDNQFPPEKQSLCPYDEDGWIFFKDLDEEDVEGWEEYNWCRVGEINEYDNYEVFEEGAEVEDIVQGDINDCYFLSAIGSLCSYPDFFNKLFYTKERSENHSYGIYLYINGKWKLVLLDDYLPYCLENYVLKEISFSSSVQKEIWVSLLEKAWAKVNGCYARIGCKGFSNEAFDVLTEAYTEQLDLRIFKKENREEELWNILLNSFKKKYVLTAGTPGAKIVEYYKLTPSHAYTLIKVYSIEPNIRLVKLSNPYGNNEYTGDWSNYSNKWTPDLKEQCEFKEEDEDFGVFYMSYEDFLKYFDVIHIAKLEKDYHTTYCKIRKNQAIKCQVIRLKIEKDSPNTYIQLYQKNPRIIKKDSTYCPGNVMSFIILVDKDFKFIKSTCGQKTHIAIEVDLKPGTYYVFCDVNYRNEYKENNIHGYIVTFYAKNQINNFRNVTDRINVVSALELSMYYYCRMNIKEIKDDNGLRIFDSQTSNKEIPFRIFCFVNTTKNPIKIKLDIKQNDSKNYCIYNDRIASEFDNYIIKNINSLNGETILILDFEGKNEFQVDYEILPFNEKITYESTHPIFNNKGEKIDDKGYLISYYSKLSDNKGFTVGLENKSNILFELKLNMKEIYDIDGDFNDKDYIKFKILPNSKKVFNLRIKQGSKDPGFDFKKLN